MSQTYSTAIISNDKNLLLRLLQNQADHTFEVYESAFSFLSSGKVNDYHVIYASGQLDSSNGISFSQEFFARTKKRIPFIFFTDQKVSKGLATEGLKSGISDIFPIEFDLASLNKRISFLHDYYQRSTSPQISVEEGTIRQNFKPKFAKRAFDIIFSLTALIILSPFFLLIAILIRLESKGPIVYRSKRVGTGYQVFDFLKFRSMYKDADQRVKDMLQTYNQYADTAKVAKDRCESCQANGSACIMPLYKDGNVVCEKLITEVESKQMFFKAKDDPRVTKIGKILRNTSIDELPQLINVLKGDMSIVGNRPLPLYEAETLTTDQFIARFMAPAGITGLWQVTKRGKGKMSIEERLELDNTYARSNSLIGDIKIILKTIPALLQKESV